MPKVEMYTTPTCAYCKMSKEFFAENNVEFSEYDVADDEAKAQEMIDKSGQMGVPVIIITPDDGSDAEIIVGFNKEKLSELLGIGA